MKKRPTKPPSKKARSAKRSPLAKNAKAKSATKGKATRTKKSKLRKRSNAQLDLATLVRQAGIDPDRIYRDEGLRRKLIEEAKDQTTNALKIGYAVPCEGAACAGRPEHLAFIPLWVDAATLVQTHCEAMEPQVVRVFPLISQEITDPVRGTGMDIRASYDWFQTDGTPELAEAMAEIAAHESKTVKPPIQFPGAPDEN